MSIIRPLQQSLVPTVQRALHSTSSAQGVKDTVGAIFHGSKEAKDEARHQHSAVVGRGKYIHEFQTHKVLPHQVEEYKEKIAAYYDGIHKGQEFDTHLTGSWEHTIGEVDTFTHIWEYKGLTGFEKTKQAVKESKGHLQFFNHEILPLIQTRSNQLCQEFAFWQTAPPQALGGIYELRSYTLKPGSLLEWEHEWRAGLEARLASGHSPVGAWFSQIGRLHQVHHIWQNDSLIARKQRRALSWQQDGWSETVAKTSSLCTEMKTNILRPLPFSPMR